MPEFIVETGSSDKAATSLVSVEYADDYFSIHPFYGEAWSELSLDRKRNLLMFASRSVSDMAAYPDTPATLGQPFPFPTILSSVIPRALKAAVCEMAYFYSTPGANTDVSSSAGVEELKIDVIQIKFAGSTTARAVPTAVVRLLKSLVGGANNSRVRRVRVGLA